MRRFAAVFSSKRDKHQECPSTTVAPSKSLLKPLAIPHSLSNVTPPSPAAQSHCSSSFSTPHLSSASDPSHSSASSSGSASLSIHTPDEDHSLTLTRSSTKRSWKSWIGAKRSISLKHRDRKDNALMSEWAPLPPPPSLPTTRIAAQPDDPDEDPHSSLSEYEYVSLPDPITPVSNNSVSPSPASARKNLQILIRNSLVCPLPVPPFVQHSRGPIYPRSCNSVRVLTRQSSLHAAMLNKRLLRRLQDPGKDLSSSDEDSILPFGLRQSPSSISPPTFPEYNICRPDQNTKVFSSSPGLRRWISRPCFEDRYLVFFPSEKGLDSRPVSGSSFAVAALEYSETLDVMVDPDFDQMTSNVTSQLSVDFWQNPKPQSVPIEQVAVNAPPPVEQSPPLHQRNSYIAVPSPLRNEHSPPVVPIPQRSKEPPLENKRLSSITSPPARSPSLQQERIIEPVVQAPKKPLVSVTSVKRVVRFVEDDDDDGVPLHLIRMKKKREEKAKFLLMEQQRRQNVEEEERQRREIEAQENERRRLVKEKERQERDKRLYADQISASRLRSEQSRAGAFAVHSNSSSNLLVPLLVSSPSPRDLERNFPRDSGRYSSRASVTPSPRREASDSALLPSHSPNRNQYDSSSGSSRPPSIAHSPAISPPNGQGSNRSRPASTYSAHTQSSSEEARPTGSRRSSFAPSASSSRGFTLPYPTRSGSSHNIHAMSSPPLAANFANYVAANDLPLLPPTAPFMKQYSSRQSLPDSSRRAGSNERAHPSLPRSNSNNSLRKEQFSSPSSSPSPHRTDVRPAHHRQSSGDSRSTRHSSHPRGNGRAQPTPSQSYPPVPRGRPPIPAYQSQQYLQTPSPWTAMPSQSGTVPTAMPVSSYSHTGTQSSRGGGNGFGGMGHDWRSTLIS